MKRFVLALLVLVACSPRGVITLDPAAAQIGEVHRIYIGTTREIDSETGQFGRERSQKVHFGRYDISVPPERKPGEITFPPRHSKANPARDFLTTDEMIAPDASSFRRDLAAEFRGKPRGQRDALIFVHGFNNTFAEGLYRLAQLSADLKIPSATVHYSWPSAGNPLGYVYDRDSALFARDGLEDLMNEVAAAGAERIILVAHSMGSALTMETLRQISIRGNTSLRGKIGGVVLISPDIDVDVFRAQARAMGELPQPFLIFGSDRDRMLSMSARLTGAAERLGNLSDVSRVADLKVTFLDVSAYVEGAGHFAVGDSPALLGLLSKLGEVDAAFAADSRGKTGLLPGVVLTVQSATEIILAPVGAIAQEISQ